VWYELKPISHKRSRLTDETVRTLNRYGTLLGRAGILPGDPLRLAPNNFHFTTIVDPTDGEVLDVWLEPGDRPGLIYYYFKRHQDDDDDVYLPPIPIAVPKYNSAARAVSATGTQAALSARAVGTIAGASLVIAVATWAVLATLSRGAAAY
jgi:hypothetical protein